MYVTVVSAQMEAGKSRISNLSPKRIWTQLALVTAYGILVVSLMCIQTLKRLMYLKNSLQASNRIF